MPVLRVLLLPLTVPNWIGCRASDAMAASVDGVLAIDNAARRVVGRRLGGRGTSRNDGTQPCVS